MKVFGMKVSLNLLSSILTVVLSAFVFSGLDIDPTTTAQELTEAILSQQWALIGVIAVGAINAVTHWIIQLRDDPSQFWAFLRSTNWWTTALSIGLGYLALYLGIEVAPEVPEEIVTAVANGEWITLVVIILTNIINPIIHRVTPSASKLVKLPSGAVSKRVPQAA